MRPNLGPNIACWGTFLSRQECSSGSRRIKRTPSSTNALERWLVKRWRNLLWSPGRWRPRSVEPCCELWFYCELLKLYSDVKVCSNFMTFSSSTNYADLRLGFSLKMEMSCSQLYKIPLGIPTSVRIWPPGDSVRKMTTSWIPRKTKRPEAWSTLEKRRSIYFCYVFIHVDDDNILLQNNNDSFTKWRQFYKTITIWHGHLKIFTVLIVDNCCTSSDYTRLINFIDIIISNKSWPDFL